MVEEIRTGSSLREAKLKQQIALRHNTKVIKRSFEVGDLVLRRNMKDSREGKLALNWEGPYQVFDKTKNGAYYLENLLGEKLARPWNVEKLRRYYSKKSVDIPRTLTSKTKGDRTRTRFMVRTRTLHDNDSQNSFPRQRTDHTRNPTPRSTVHATSTWPRPWSRTRS